MLHSVVRHPECSVSTVETVDDSPKVPESPTICTCLLHESLFVWGNLNLSLLYFNECQTDGWR